MDLQLSIVAVLLVLASGYLAHRCWRTWFARAGTGCGGSCGCSRSASPPAGQSEALISEDQLLSRLRPRS